MPINPFNFLRELGDANDFEQELFDLTGDVIALYSTRSLSTSVHRRSSRRA